MAPDIPARDRLIVALDVATVDEADALVARLGDHAGFYKIGMQLQFAGGLDYARRLADRGKRVFLDMKLLDIDETVERAVRAVAAMGVDFLTIHATRRAVPAAARGAAGTGLGILAVTVLTSLGEDDLPDMAGEGATIGEVVLHRARLAVDGGAAGVIASAGEARAIRDLAGDGFRIVTPGIRPTGAAADDQKRVATPRSAIAAGADHIVVGRPIYRADDPARAAAGIVAEIAAALDERG